MGGIEGIPARELLKSDSAQFAQLAKQPSLTFPAQFFSKLLFALKIRAGKGTAQPNVPRARLLMLCWGCEKCVELLLFIHFRALEDLLYYQGLFCWKELLLYFKMCFKWRSTSTPQVWMVVSSLVFMFGNVRVCLAAQMVALGAMWLLSVPFVIPQRKCLQH